MMYLSVFIVLRKSIWILLVSYLIGHVLAMQDLDLIKASELGMTRLVVDAVLVSQLYHVVNETCHFLCL